MFELSSDLLAEHSATASPDQINTVMEWLTALSTLHVSKPKGPVAEIIARQFQCSVSSVNHKYALVKKHGPQVLFDGRSKRKRSVSLYGHRSPLFVKWVEDFYYQIARENATPTVQGMMLGQLMLWREDPTNDQYKIPGYDTPPLDSAESNYQYPFGWSQRRLNDIKPDDYNRALATKGMHKANEMLPPIYTTRVGLHPGEVYLFDDVKYDVKFIYGNKPVDPVALHVDCLFSGCNIMRGIRPFLKDNPEGEKSLNERDMIWLTVELLSFEGYYRHNCELIVEAGTATLREEMARLISVVTDGVVKVRVGGVSKEEVAGVRVLAKGNPRFKAAKESWFNILHNRVGALPMQTANTYQNKPEATTQLEVEETALLKKIQHLPPQIRDKFHFETHPWARGTSIVHHIAEHVINRRREHNLEGWEDLGFEFVEYLLGEQWIDENEYQLLPSGERGLIQQRMDRGEIVSRLNRMNPREVFESGRSELKTISPFHWHLLVPQKLALPRTIPANRTIEIRRLDLGPAPVIFEPSYYAEKDQKPQPLPAGKDVLIYVSPHRPEFALFTDTERRPIGIVFAVQKRPRTDREYILEQWAKRATFKAQIGASANRYNAEKAEERIERREQNKALLAEHGITSKSKPKKKKAQKKKPASKSALLPDHKTPKPAPEKKPKTNRKNIL